MSYDDLLGCFVKLPVRRFGPPGAFLALDPSDPGPQASVVLLPGAEIPEGTKEGDELLVFLYLDSEDRPIATLRAPKLERDEVAFLTVTDVTRFGAFVDWGLPKELLVPYAEQTRDVLVGERHPIGLFLDNSGRLAGTMRVTEMLRDKGEFQLDEWVEGEAWRYDPQIGLFVIVERRFVGLVPAFEPHRLGRGDASRFRVTHILDDGKIELSLRGHTHEEAEKDAQNVLSVLGRLETSGGAKVGDRSSPEEIRSLFGISKKVFKRVIGNLLKNGDVALDKDGNVRVLKQ